MKITNRKVLITGGASGIGLALANEFMRRNNKILICGRNSEKLRDAKERLPGLVVKSCDLTDRTTGKPGRLGPSGTGRN